MEEICPLRFFDFPFEIQELIMRKCLEGWKATIEVHEKGEKTTARIFSSVIYQALMLSLTCRTFHIFIQDIQRDPRLFSGELDLIEANAQMTYLLGYDTRARNIFYGNWKAYPLYRTQVFIKNKPYDRKINHWRQNRIEYHANVREWVMQNTTSLGLWADEITSRVGWARFPKLEHVTVYWPHTKLPGASVDRYLCQHTHDELSDMAKKARNTDEAWDGHMIKPVIESLTERGLTVTLHLESKHVHTDGAQVMPIFVRQEDGTHSSRLFYTLECQVQIRGEQWKVDRVLCDHAVPITDDIPPQNCNFLATSQSFG